MIRMEEEKSIFFLHPPESDVIGLASGPHLSSTKNENPRRQGLLGLDFILRAAAYRASYIGAYLRLA